MVFYLNKAEIKQNEYMIIENKIVITSGESIHYEEKTKVSKGQQMTILDFGDIYKHKNFLNYTFKICVLVCYIWLSQIQA